MPKEKEAESNWTRLPEHRTEIAKGEWEELDESARWKGADPRRRSNGRSRAGLGFLCPLIPLAPLVHNEGDGENGDAEDRANHDGCGLDGVTRLGDELRGRRRGRGLRGLLGLGVRVAEHASRELLLVHTRDEVALTIVFDRDSE